METNFKVVPTTYPLIYRTYSRKKDDQQQENITDIWDRVFAGLCKIGKFDKSETELIRHNFYNGYSYPSGRYMWVGGTEWSEKPANYAGLYNCFSAIIKDWEDIRLAFQLLMEGCGVGSTFELCDIYQLNAKYPYSNLIKTGTTYDITEKDEIGRRYREGSQEQTDTLCYATLDGDYNTVTIIVGDSRQAWAKALKDLLELCRSERETTKISHINIDLSFVRPKGTPLKGFGGVANPDYLSQMFKSVIKLLVDYRDKEIDAYFIEKLKDEMALTAVSGSIRRCLPENALVHTVRGLVCIKDVIVGDLVQTPIGYRKVTNKFNQGVQEVWKIKTNGSYLTATPNHRVAVYTSIGGNYEWKCVSELQEGDRLLHTSKSLEGIDTNLPPDFTQNRPLHSTTCKKIEIPDLDEGIAWLIGFTHANGYVSIGLNKKSKPYGSVSWSTNDLYGDLCLEIVDKIKTNILKFGITCKSEKSKNENTHRITCSSIRLAEYFLRYVKQPNVSINIPDYILQSKESIRSSYLAGLFDGDGCKNNRPPQLVATVYPDFARQVSTLYSSLAIPTRITTILPNTEKWKTRYYVTIPALKHLFNEKISKYSLKGKIKESTHENRTYNFPSDLVLNYAEKSELRKVGLLTNNRATTLLKVENSLQLKLDIPITVKGLDSIDVCQTYDIEVEEAHCFYCDGILTHNSALISQFSPEDEVATSLKQNLWQQDENGKWRIDPERDCFRMANHTQVFHHLPSRDNWIKSLTNQYRTGEGALQFAPMAVLRANDDIFSESEKVEILQHFKDDKPEYAEMEMCAKIYERSRTNKEAEFRCRSYLLNPCITGDALVQTDKGLVPIKRLEGKQFIAVVQGKEYPSTEDGFWFTGHKKVYQLETKLNKILRATPEHKILVYRNITTYTAEQKEVQQWVEMRDIRVGDMVVVNDLLEKYDEVVKISDTNTIEAVYDCTIPSLGAFSANGIIVHNCAEVISGHSFLCNLSEVHLNLLAKENDEVIDNAFRACTLMACALLHHKFVDRQLQFARSIDPIIGVSFTGLFDFFVQRFGVRYLIWWQIGRPKDLYFENTEIKFLQRWRSVVYETMVSYCQKHDLKIPRRYTLVKPAGSLSLISGASNGWHPQKYWQYIRRMTFSKNDPVALTCMEMGYQIVPSQSARDENGNLLDDPFDERVTEWLVEIPVRVSYYDLIEKANETLRGTTDPNNYSAISQLRFYHLVQKYYSTHTTSATIEFREDEIEKMADYMVENQLDMEYISFATLPRFESNSAYPRLPFEPISDEEYEARMKLIDTNIDFYETLCNYNRITKEHFDRGSSGCDSAKCIVG